MPRPGLIIGLGGTGQWVLTWLKRDLMLSNNNQMPKNVRLLGIDTATKLEAGASRVLSSGRREEAAVVGDVSLGDGEFIYIGGDSRPIAQRVQEGRLKQIGQWFPAGKWLTTQMPATFILDDGAGRLRQFGRMAIYKDILGQETGSQIWRALRAAIEGVRSATTEQRRLEIMVVGSFAGGTGSGMFIDIALILRMLAQQMNVHHVLRGIFALPTVFTNAPDAEMRARSFAAWRELNRFMVVDANFPMPTIEYVENNPRFRIQPNQRLFDACYLVDGRRNGQPLSEDAKFGVFPMMAEALSAILDEEAGTAYTQWIFTNLAPEYARRPETPMYSALGAFTVQVPAQFKQELSTHQLAKDILLRMLGPRIRPDKDGRLVSSGAERLMALAAPDHNLEDRGFAGRMRSLRLLRESIERDGKTTRPTRFHARIADLYDGAIDSNRRAQVIERLARAGGQDPKSPAGIDSWVSFFPDLGDDARFESVRSAVMEHMSYNIVTSYGRRQNEKEEDARPRLKKIPEDVRVRFGGITSKGEEVEDYYGSCGDVLQEAQKVQLILFRQLVRAQLVNMLMGRSDNPIEARSGKLGYAWDYFDGNVVILEQFLKLMDDVKRRREEVKPELKIAGLSDRAKRFVDATTGKKIFWFFEHPDVKGAELAFLQAQQRLMEIRREDILHSFVINSARTMREICMETRDELQRWIYHLSTGDDAAQVPGMWDGVQTSLQGVKNAHSFDSRSEKAQKLVSDQEIVASEADVADALGCWRWLVDFEGDPLHLSLNAQIVPSEAGVPVQVLQNPATGVSTAIRTEIGKQNQQAILDLATRRFAGVSVRTTVAEEIKREYPRPEQFVNAIADVSAEPLFNGDPEAKAHKKSNLIRVQADKSDNYFYGVNGIEGLLRNNQNLERGIRDDTFGIQVVGSENPYKLTLVRTNDLYEFSHFSEWNDCRFAYAQHMEEKGIWLDPVLMQNFAAEQRAAEYESQLTRGGLTYQPLHPRVVMLLEDPEALRQFIYLGIFGMVTEEDSNKQYRWQLTWEKPTGSQTIWLTRGWSQDDKTQRPRPDIFSAIHGYVIMKTNQESGRRDEIDTEFARRLIDARLAEIKPDGEERMIRENISEGGFVSWLKSFAYDPNVPDRMTRPDYADLAQVVEMILLDRLKQIEEGKKRDMAKTGGKGPFKVFRPSTDEKPDETEGGGISGTPWKK